jgi:hypothetical protein
MQLTSARDQHIYVESVWITGDAFREALSKD